MENPTPNDPIAWVLGIAATLIVSAIALINRVIGRSNPCDREMQQFREAVHEDLIRFEKKLDKAIEDGRASRKEIYERLRHTEERVTRIDARCPKQEPT